MNSLTMTGEAGGASVRPAGMAAIAATPTSSETQVRIMAAPWQWHRRYGAAMLTASPAADNLPWATPLSAVMIDSHRHAGRPLRLALFLVGLVGFGGAVWSSLAADSPVP